MKKRMGFAVRAAWWACFALMLICGFVLEIGTNETLYFELQTRAGLPEAAGISAADMEKLDVHLAACLRGRADWNVEWLDPEGAAVRATVDGVERDAFNDREIRHMEDCQRLFALLRAVRRGLAIAAALLILLALALEWRARPAKGISAACLWVGSLALCVPLVAFALWAAVDFGSAFTFFHHMLFTNDLWLLDPATDLLIRICPQSMFANMGLRIALRAAVVLLGIPLLYTLVQAAVRRVRIRKRNANETVEL